MSGTVLNTGVIALNNRSKANLMRQVHKGRRVINKTIYIVTLGI